MVGVETCGSKLSFLSKYLFLQYRNILRKNIMSDMGLLDFVLEPIFATALKIQLYGQKATLKQSSCFFCQG